MYSGESMQVRIQDFEKNSKNRKHCHHNEGGEDDDDDDDEG